MTDTDDPCCIVCGAAPGFIGAECDGICAHAPEGVKFEDDGYEPTGFEYACPRCNGTGQPPGEFRPCPDCYGEGYLDE